MHRSIPCSISVTYGEPSAASSILTLASHLNSMAFIKKVCYTYTSPTESKGTREHKCILILTIGTVFNTETEYIQLQYISILHVL